MSPISADGARTTRNNNKGLCQYVCIVKTMTTNWSPDNDEWFASTEALSTQMRFQKYFVVIENASIDSRPKYLFDAFLTVHTKMLGNDRIASCDVNWTLCACYKYTRLRYFQSLLSFSTVRTNTICMRFRVDPLLRTFPNRCVFDENAQRISVEGRPKRIEMYAFSHENALVWTRGLRKSGSIDP